jgi:hypothetical protein
MLPKTHILLGFLFAYITYWFTSLSIFQASLIFLASVLIDFDHYLWYVFKKKNLNLKKAYNFLKIKRKSKRLMIFHTIEFHIFVGLLGFIWAGFFYILIGMLFHSITDLIGLIYKKEVWRRRYWLLGG